MNGEPRSSSASAFGISETRDDDREHQAPPHDPAQRGQRQDEERREPDQLGPSDRLPYVGARYPATINAEPKKTTPLYSRTVGGAHSVTRG